MVEPAANYYVPDKSISCLELVEKNEDDQFELPLMAKEELTHDTIIFRFKLPKEDWVIGLPVGTHLMIHATIEGDKELSKKYTPISPVTEKGSVSFIIKVYHKTEEFPLGGSMSQYLYGLKIGDKIRCEGPKGFLNYLGEGKFLIKKKEVKKTKIGLLAGGTGLTPVYQVIQAATLANESLPLVFLFSNKTKDDILAKEKIDEFAKTH